MLDLAVRLRNRTRLEMIARVPPLRSKVDREYAELLQRHQSSLPTLPAAHQEVADVVRAHGVCITSLDALGVPGTPELQAGLTRLAAGLADRPAAGAHTTRPALDTILTEAAVWQWGLQDQLLDLAENHLGLPARYYGADVRREAATAQAVGVRQWHRDVEDHRMLKILVWLNDVDAGGGPFEYVDGLHTERLTADLRYVSGFVEDDAFAAQLPRSEWRKATGPTWTAVVADTRNVFHRAMPPVVRDRYSVTFSYTSRTPIMTLPAPVFTDRQQALATAGLTERQLACLPPAIRG